MRVDKHKFEIVMANKCMTSADLSKKSGVSQFTITRMQTKAETQPATIGKIAKALEVPVEELIETTAATVNQKN